MSFLPQSTIDDLPDEVLALILKLVADLPADPRARLPFPVAAGRVSQRWRNVVLGSPELWTTICISHRSRSWIWVPVFLRRSRAQPLDISINLESYLYRDGTPCFPAPIPLSRALTMLGAHIGRWRGVSLRGYLDQGSEFCEYLACSPGAACRLQSVHFSGLGSSRWYSDISSLSELFGNPSFRSLRVNGSMNLDGFAGFKALQSLDIDVSMTFNLNSLEFRQMFEPTSTLTTLVLRNFSPRTAPTDPSHPIEAPTIRSFAVSFSASLYPTNYFPPSAGFQSLTNMFSLPNLEYLEILGGFTENDAIRVPEQWEDALFPHLRTLRLEDVGFSASGLAFIQAFSPGITALELVCTTGNRHLLASRPDAELPWPALGVLTVETLEGVAKLEWLAPFVALRASPGAHTRIAQLTLPPWAPCASLAGDIHPATSVRWLDGAPSAALMDGYPGPGFYVDALDLRAVEFEHVPAPISYCSSCGDWRDSYCYLEDMWEWDPERLEAEFEEEFKVAGELVRAKGMWRELRRGRRRGFKVESKAKAGRSSKRRRCDVREDFCLV
ncbi:hypothetical protein DFH09DRAFT_203487 [Mycena vulgaris]|nr:hypothetical protein DFH09DRAFT_203487 [Mycena vulgaris]